MKPSTKITQLTANKNKGYAITLHPGTRELINAAATSAFDFPISFFL